MSLHLIPRHRPRWPSDRRIAELAVWLFAMAVFALAVIAHVGSGA